MNPASILVTHYLIILPAVKKSKVKLERKSDKNCKNSKKIL